MLSRDKIAEKFPMAVVVVAGNFLWQNGVNHKSPNEALAIGVLAAGIYYLICWVFGLLEEDHR